MGIYVLTEKEFNTMYVSSQCFAIIPVGSITQSYSHPSEIAQLLSNFSHVFNPPTSLPPKQSHDHQIMLQPNVQPVSVRSYRYPFYQKIKIQRMVKQLLHAGFIHPSHIPFTSPVLLVRKADGDELLQQITWSKIFFQARSSCG